MRKIDTLIEILYKIYLILNNKNTIHQLQTLPPEELMTRQEVKDYLGISESTYKRKVKDGTLQPIKMPGGDRFTKSSLLNAFMESRCRGRA